MAQNNRLGSGLAAILGNDVESIVDNIQSSALNPELGKRIVLKLTEIRPNPYQPRQTFDSAKLKELADSIRQHGVFTPIIVRKTVAGYELIAGERRMKASQLAGKTDIPAIVMDFDDQQMMEVSLLENIQRENLSAIEEAIAYRQLMEKLNYTQEKLSERVGKSREHISNTLRLLRLPSAVQNYVDEGKLTVGQVRPLITLDNEATVREIAERIIKEGLSARDVEKLVKNYKPKPVKPVTDKPMDPALYEVQKNLQKKFSTQVKITGKSINISYSDISDLNRILELLHYQQED